MEELIYKPEKPSGHPNYELEEEFKSIEMLIERGENEDDIKNMYYLKDKILKKKFDKKDIALFKQFKDRYIKTDPGKQFDNDNQESQNRLSQVIQRSFK
jgi:hypothetical protein